MKDLEVELKDLKKISNDLTSKLSNKPEKKNKKYGSFN